MSFATALYDDEGAAYDAPFIKLVCRGKVKSPLAGPVSLHSGRLYQALAFSSTYGLLFHLGEGLRSIKVQRWPSVESAYTKVERVQLQKANQALIKETISAPEVIAHAELPARFTCIALSNAEHLLFAWNRRGEGVVDLCCFSTASLAAGEASKPLWQKEGLPRLAQIRLSFDDRLLAALTAAEDGSATLWLLDACSGKVLAQKELEKPAAALCWAPKKDILGVGLGAGSGEVVFFDASGVVKEKQSGEMVKVWTLETWNTDDDAVEFDQGAEIHQLCWPEPNTLLVCHRAMPGVDQAPLPFVLIYKVNVEEKRAEAAWFVDNPLDFNEEKDKEWPHMYYVEYFETWSVFMLSSSWTQRVALIGLPKEASDAEWKRWQVMAPSGDNASCYPEVLSATFWSLAQRPWMWVEEHGSKRIDTSTYPIGFALATCATKPISPFFILGASRELDQIPDFSPPPTLLIATSDGFIEVVGLAHKNFAVPKQIPGISPKLLPIEDIPRVQRQVTEPPQKNTLPSSDEKPIQPVQSEKEVKPQASSSATKPLSSNFTAKLVSAPDSSLATERTDGQSLAQIEAALKLNPAFSACNQFAGAVEGYSFRQGSQGVGYYPLTSRPIKFKLLPDFSRDEAKELLERIYSKVNPSKTEAHVVKALQRYQGSYRRMFDALEAKYNISIADFQGAMQYQSTAKVTPPNSQLAQKEASRTPAAAAPVVKIQELHQHQPERRVVKIDVPAVSSEGKPKSVDSAELDALRVKCERLETDLDRASDFKVKFETPPRVKLTHVPVQPSSIRDRIAALRRHEGASSFSDLHKSSDASSAKNGDGHAQHLETVMKLVSDRTSRLLAYCASIAKENAAVDALWKSNDETFATRTAELRAAVAELHDFVSSAKRTSELEALQDRLAAVRRNYFLHEWAFHRCRALVSGTDDASTADADTDLRAAGSALEASVEEVCRAAEAVLEEVEQREQLVLRRRRQLVQQSKLESLKRLGGVQTPTRQEVRKQAQRDVLKRVMDTYQRARLAQEAIHQQEARLRELERECNLAAGVKGADSLRAEEAILALESVAPRQREVMQQEEEDIQLFVAELYASIDSTLSANGPPKVHTLAGLPVQVTRLSSTASPQDVQRAERQDRRAQRKSLAESIRSSPEPQRVAIKPEASMKRLQETTKVPVPVSQLRETVIAAPPSYVPVPAKDLSVSFAKPEPPAPAPQPVIPTTPPAAKPEPSTKEPEAPQPTQAAKQAEAPKSSGLLFGSQSAQPPPEAPSASVPAPAPVPKTPEATGKTSAAPAGVPGSYDDVDMAATLKQFYMSHNPSNVAKIETTLAKYKGREASLIAGLEKKYKTTVALVKKQPAPPTTPPSTPAASSPFGTVATPPTQKKETSSSTVFGGTPTAFGSPQPAPSTTPVFGSSGFQTVPTTASPQTTQSPFGAVQASPPAFGADYRTQLVNFYTKYNPSKLATVDQVLTKYRGQESKLFASLRKKYQVPPTETFNAPSSAQPGAGTPQAGTAFGQAQPSTSGFGAPSFGSTGFGATAGTTSVFGQQPAQQQQQQQPQAGGFGSTGFGSTATPSSGFGGTGFGTSSFGATQGGSGFGQAGYGSTSGSFGQQVDYRAKLVEFYTKHNPSKLSSVDAVLVKYRGRENELFAQLERKYSTKVGGQGFGTGSGMIANTGSAATGQSFGSTGFGTPGGFASTQPSGFGNVQGTTAFGSQPTAFGGQPATSTSGGFGNTSAMGGFGSTGFGAAATSGFGNQAAAGTGFGSTAFQSGSSFGKTNFGGSSFTQMRK